MRIIVILIISIIITQNLFSQVRVNGYYRKNGTYVEPHYRSSPNSNPFDNYSYPGNTNPFTGKTSTGNQQTYLENYYFRDNSTKPIRSNLNNSNSYPSNSNQNSVKKTTNNNQNKLNNKSTEEILREYKLEEEQRMKKEEELINNKINQFKKISKKQNQNEN